MPTPPPARRTAHPVLSRLAPAIVAGIALGCGACSREDDAPAQARGPAPVEVAIEDDLREALEARADAAAVDLMRTLVAELTAALSSGPASNAVAVCSEVAQDITREAAARHEVSMRRTALRVRNPLNAPDAHERAVLERWLAAWPAEPRADRPGDDVQVVRTEDGGAELRLLRPISLMETCLLCHGPKPQIDPGVQAVVANLYPEDRATGFEAGDLRGAVSVRVRVPHDAGDRAHEKAPAEG